MHSYSNLVSNWQGAVVLPVQRTAEQASPQRPTDGLLRLRVGRSSADPNLPTLAPLAWQRSPRPPALALAQRLLSFVRFDTAALSSSLHFADIVTSVLAEPRICHVLL